MSANMLAQLPRRERQILEHLYQKQNAKVADVVAALPEAPSYSAVRAMLGRLEKKGFVSHREDGRTYVYFPTTPASSASRSALRHVVTTFFRGSAVQAVNAILDIKSGRLSAAELSELKSAIRRAEKAGR